MELLLFLEPVEKKKEVDPEELLDKVPPILAMEKPYQLNIELDSFTLAWQPAIYPSGAKQVPIKYVLSLYLKFVN